VSHNVLATSKNGSVQNMATSMFFFSECGKLKSIRKEFSTLPKKKVLHRCKILPQRFIGCSDVG
jgi:hypothetical protein